MAESSSTPLFTVGQEIANFLISCGILSKAWEESLRASKAESFTLNEYEDVAYFAFPSFQRIKYFIPKESQCGEGNMHTDHKLFSGCHKGNDGEPAFIHPGALTLFLHIMEKTDFQAKLHMYTDSKQTKLKPIIFVGHSMGGAVATLATLWVLGKRVRQSSPFCITFGCPLLGDERLVEAVDRENWGCNFCHVVSRHDIVPLMLLAPIESIAAPFTTICCYWEGINVRDSLIQDACRTLLNHVLDSPSSQYRPFGTYMLCSRNGAACIENTGAVLEMLRLTMRSLQGSFDELVEACLSEHMYNSVLEELMQNSIGGIRIAISDSEESSYEMGISSQLEAIGVGARDDLGQLALRTGEVRNAYYQIDDSHLFIHLSHKKIMMTELEWYKEACEKAEGITYYDSFKCQDDQRDLHANFRRAKLAEFWDDIVEMWGNHELPRDFETRNKWINAGTTYRRLVEPLDIALYYRMNRNGGNYLSDERPRRHKVLQEWMEAKEKTRSSRVQGRRTKPASLTQDSCFWAYVEEAWKDLESLKQGEKHRLQNLEKFEEYVTKMVKALSISSDVLFEGSSFMMWWEEWKRYNKAQSPGWSSRLYQIMESESPLKFERIDSLTVPQENISSTGEAKDSIPSNKEVNDSIPANKEVNESIPSNKVGKDSIPSKKEVNDSIPSNKEVKDSIPSNKEVNDSIPSNKEVKESIRSNKEGKDSIPSNQEVNDESDLESELILQQGRMFELEWYKMICHEKGDGYYDSFKIPNDSTTNSLRVTLNKFWDGIIGICNSPPLPSDFQSPNKWINVGTAYRKLVEPLDIAQYYSTSKDSGNYLDKRPKRYKVLEQWLEHRKSNRSSRDQRSRTKLPFVTRDSCFWARVEEALKDLQEGADHKKESLENFEKYVTEMIEDCKISSDVFLDGSSFMKWWRDYKEHRTSEWNSKSPLYNLKSPFWKP